MNWQTYINNLNRILSNISSRDHRGEELGAEAGFQTWQKWSEELRSRDQHLFLVGNGASASMASHFATDIAKNGRIRAHVFTDMSLLTAVSNDIDFRKVYSEPLTWYGNPGDMLIAISSSGNSPNIIEVIVTARRSGIRTITLSAMHEDNAIRKLGDLNFYIPASSYGHAESGHATILHHWMDLMEIDHD